MTILKLWQTSEVMIVSSAWPKTLKPRRLG